MELNMLGDWLDNPKPEDGCQEIVKHIEGEYNSTELLSPGAE
jgi:hypothetical protein